MERGKRRKHKTVTAPVVIFYAPQTEKNNL